MTTLCFCSAVDGRGVSWIVGCGQVEVGPCGPVGAVGSASWECGETGEFVTEEPDRAGCESPWLPGIQDDLAAGNKVSIFNFNYTLYQNYH